MEKIKAEISQKQALDKIIDQYIGKPGALLSILEEAQKTQEHKYLPQETLSYISLKTEVPLSRIYSVVTFYAFFNLEPQGQHSIIVCRGTACHTRRSKNLLDYLKNLLGFKESSAQEREKLFYTTKDRKFTLRTVACFGQCALAPVVEIDGNIHSHMTEDKLRKLILNLRKKKK